MAKKWTHAEFEAYVRRLETEAHGNPAQFRQRVIGWIVLGYVYLALLLAGTLALLALIGLILINGRFSAGLIKVALILLFFAFTLLRSLWVKMEAPVGIALTPEDAPTLFAMVERLRAKTGAPPFAQLLLTTDFNAMAAQVPRLGILGWPRNYLVVGLPLMQALSSAEFESVVAHELGHLRSGHGHFASRVYRIYTTWLHLAHSGSGLLAGFARWYVPRLDAYTFPLRRQDEFEADRIAADAAGARVAADALCALHVRSEALQVGFWRTLDRRLAVETEAPRHVFAETGRALREKPLPPEQEAKVLRDALLEDTTYADSHPALKDRLGALGEEPRVPAFPTTTAAEAFFTDHLQKLTDLLDGVWYRERAERWREHHARVREEKAKHDTRAARVAQGERLSDEDAYAHAAGVEEYESDEAALPLYRALFSSEKTGDAARFAVGRIQIQRDDPEGAALLEDLVQKGSIRSGDALALLQAYHKRQGDSAQAQAAYARSLAHADVLEAAREEGSQIVPSDDFAPHGLNAEAIIALRETLMGFPELGQAFLVQKQLKHFAGERTFLILAIALKKRLRTKEQQDYEALQAAINAAVPMAVVPLYGNFAWMRRRVEAVADSLIYAA